MRIKAFAVAIAILAIACGGAPTSTAPGSPGSSTTAAPTAGPSGAATSPAPGPSDDAGPLPAPTLSDPAAIGKALWDPAQVEQGVVSLIDQLGVPIYDDTGKVVRASSRPGPDGLWLTETEVRWLIEMGREDATAIAAHQAPFTLGDLSAALRPLMPSLTEQQILDAYIAAYRPVPGDLVRESLAGHAFLRETPFTRVHLWLLLVDGVLGRPGAGATARGTGIATYASWPRTAAAPVASVSLPPITSPIAALTALEFQFLLVQAPLLGSRIQVDFTVTPKTAHEGHGGPGPTVAFDARNMAPATPLISPFLGTALLLPRASGLAGLPITFVSPDEEILDEHGTMQGAFGIPIFTDASGLAHLGYQVQVERAAGQGNISTAVANVRVVVDLRTALASQYIIAPELLPFLWGTRVLPDVLALEWHEPVNVPGTYVIVLTGPRDGAGQYSGTTNIYCTETPDGAGGTLWTVVGQPLKDVTDFDMGDNPSGWSSVSVETSAQREFSPWFARSDVPGETAQISVARVGQLVNINGTGSLTDSAGHRFTIDIAVTCSPSN